MVGEPTKRMTEGPLPAHALTHVALAQEDDSVGIGAITNWFLALFLGLGLIIAWVDHSLLAKTLAQAGWACLWAVTLSAWGQRRRAKRLENLRSDMDEFKAPMRYATRAAIEPMAPRANSAPSTPESRQRAAA